MALMFVALRLVVGSLFVFTGMIKVTDRISPELYAKGLEEFVKFADVFPLKRFGISIEPITFLTAVGWIELVGGLLLAVGPRILQEISNVVLSVIMIGSDWKHLPRYDECVQKGLSFVPIHVVVVSYVGGMSQEEGAFLFVAHPCCMVFDCSICTRGAIYSLLMLKKPLYMCIPATICLAILLVLLYVWGRDREKKKGE